MFKLSSSSKNSGMISSKRRKKTYGAGVEEEDPIGMTVLLGAAMSGVARRVAEEERA